MLGSLNYSPMMNRVVFFLIEKYILCVQRMRRNYHSRGNRGTASRVTNDWRLRSWGGCRLRSHINLNRARKRCGYVEVGINVAVMEGLFVVVSKSIKLAQKPEEPKLEVALPCERPARGRQRFQMSGPREFGPSHLRIDVSVGGSVPSKTTGSEAWERRTCHGFRI